MLWGFQSWKSSTEIISRLVIVKQAWSISVVIIVCVKQPLSIFIPISVTKIGIVKRGLKSTRFYIAICSPIISGSKPLSTVDSLHVGLRVQPCKSIFGVLWRYQQVCIKCKQQNRLHHCATIELQPTINLFGLDCGQQHNNDLIIMVIIFVYLW